MRTVPLAGKHQSRNPGSALLTPFYLVCTTNPMKFAPDWLPLKVSTLMTNIYYTLTTEFQKSKEN